jgi:glutamate formiminotransferase
VRILTVPNWSLADPGLLAQMRALAELGGVNIHYWQGDVDHRRAVTAFSGDSNAVFSTLLTLAEKVKAKIDLSRHHGVHPRIGFLDVVPFLPLEGDRDWLVEMTHVWAKTYARDLGVPVYLYEHSAQEGRPKTLPEYRSKAFVADPLRPDFGGLPWPVSFGATVVGVRDPLLAVNVNLATKDVEVAKSIARDIRDGRKSGDARFVGVRALGFALDSVGLVQVSMNMTAPGETSFDEVCAFIEHAANARGVQLAGTELIGVIRREDVDRASLLTIDPAQIV